MEIAINISAPDLVSAINKLAVAITGTHQIRDDAPASAKQAKPAKPKLAPLVEVEVEVEVEAAPATPPTPAAAAVPRTIDEVKTLAALKAKKVGAAVIKGLIADTGSTQIADIADPHVLASLAANLDAL